MPLGLAIHHTVAWGSDSSTGRGAGPAHTACRPRPHSSQAPPTQQVACSCEGRGCYLLWAGVAWPPTGGRCLGPLGKQQIPHDAEGGRIGPSPTPGTGAATSRLPHNAGCSLRDVPHTQPLALPVGMGSSGVAQGAGCQPAQGLFPRRPDTVSKKRVGRDPILGGREVEGPFTTEQVTSRDTEVQRPGAGGQRE